MKTTPKVHAYDFDRTALDGTRTLCGRHTTTVKYRVDGKRITCKRCFHLHQKAALARIRSLG